MSEFQPDLLGGKVSPGRRTPKIRRNARPRIVPAGHADKPGTGPAGETCGSCHWLTDYRFRKLYHKCGARTGDQWKGGRATDIKPLDAACSKFQPASAFVRGQTIAAPIVIGETDGPTTIDREKYVEDARELVDFVRGHKATFTAFDEAASISPAHYTAVMGGAGGGKTDRTNGQVRATCLDMIAAAADGLTADECAARLGQEPSAIRPRVTELFKADMIEKTGARRATASGGTAAVWKAKGGTDATATD